MKNDDTMSEAPENPTPETPSDAEPTPDTPSGPDPESASDPASDDSMPTVTEPVEQLEPVAVPESDGDSLLPEGAYVDYPDDEPSSS